MPTGPADPFGLASHDHGDVVDSGPPQQPDLPSDQGLATEGGEAFRRFRGIAVQPGALARSENDGAHHRPPATTGGTRGATAGVPGSFGPRPRNSRTFER